MTVPSDDAAPAEPSGGSPRPGVRPGRTRRRRTASMKVSRPAAPADAGATRGPGGPAEERKPGAGGAVAPDRTGPPAGATRVPRRRWLLDSQWLARFVASLDTRPGRVVLIGSAVVATTLGPLMIYSLFAVAYVFRHRLRRAVARVPLGPRTTLGVLILLSGLLREVLTWVAEYVQGDELTALWHPQLVPDLLIGIGFYTAWALGWSFALIWFRYRLAEALLTQAVFGLVIENFGQTLFAGLATLPSGAVLWLYAMALSASTLGVAWVLAGDKLATLPERPSDNPFRYAAPPILVTASLVVVFTVWGQLVSGLGWISDPAPIRERPFW